MTEASTLTRSGIPGTVEHLRATFRTGRTRPAAWRVEQLQALERMLAENESEFAGALTADLGRRPVEGWLADLAPVAAESRYARRHLRSWMRSRRVGMPLSVLPGRAWVQPEPLGVVLIIGPWNYPVYLTLGPLVGALAAGNCAVIKPSEHAPAVADALARLVPRYLDPEAVAVVTGAAEETQELLAQGFDHAFFTGGPEIGKAVMAAAAEHLTPVTLELGGKCPVILAPDADVEIAARRIAWTKLMNSGQTCIAPDYVLAHRDVRDRFLAALDGALTTFADEPTLPIVNRRHAERLAGLLAESGGTCVRGGGVDADAQRAEIAVVTDPDPESRLMREEIFGPILPVLTVDDVDEAVEFVRDRPKPLALYLFTGDRAIERRVLTDVSSGGAVINHLMFHVLVTQLPFGGVGTSGTGAYHGRWGFDTFSHRKAVLRKPVRPDPSIVYPPYTALKERLLRKVF